MAIKSKKHARQNEIGRLRWDRPFAPTILARAKKIAKYYQIVVAFEDGEYYGRGVEMPYAFGDGKTVKQCVKNTRGAFVAGIASLLQNGDLPPTPISEEIRDQQIKIRVSSAERLSLETKARQSGAAGISEYIRAVALAK